MIEISVIIPAYNESACIAANTRKVQEALIALRVSYEIVLVNDGSTDRTAEVMQSLRSSSIRVISSANNQGKGHAVRAGMLAASGRYCLFMDADLSTSLEAIGPFLTAMQANTADVILANRRPLAEQRQAHQPFYRIFLGKTFTLLSRICVGCNIQDFTCGFKILSRQASQTIFSRQRTSRWAYDTEIVAIALIHKLRVSEMPVEWNHVNNSKVRAWRDVFTSLNDLARIKLNMIAGKYR